MSAAPPIVLDEEQRGELERIVRASSSEVRMLERARIVLRCADGRSVEQITGELGCSPPTVAKWRGVLDHERLLPAGVRAAL
ncbi:MAG: helix-turn-helix domain-containing protein, partial [Gaiellaceae bacterium]